jgi:ABC-type phosphate transport system permease subunit
VKAKVFTLRAYSTAVVTLAVGVFLSIKLNDWSWFSRSGSLVVINGILLTSYQIIQHIQALSHYQYQRQRESQFQRDWANEEKHHFIRDDHESRWKSEKYGLYMLIMGTLVWGFGDLLNQL